VASRLLVLMKKVDDESTPPEETPSMGRIGDIVEFLRDYNTAPEEPGDSMPQFLYGPGITIQAPMSDEPVKQLLVTLVEEEIAWAVVTRICRDAHWKMVDPESGRSFG
jgi:hypothetical protein